MKTGTSPLPTASDGLPWSSRRRFAAIVMGIVQSDAFLRDQPVVEKGVTVAKQ